MEQVQVPQPIAHDPLALCWAMDPDARAVLLNDTPDYWRADQNALRNLTHLSIYHPDRFDALSENNKYVVASRVRHILDELAAAKYVRHLGTEAPDHIWALQVSGCPPEVYYLRNEAIWDRILDLASRPGAGGGTATDPAADELCRFMDNARSRCDLVEGTHLELCLAHARGYAGCADAADRRPDLDLDHLGADAVHAFLCAYAACFHE